MQREAGLELGLRAGVDLPQAFVFDAVVSAQAVGGAEGLVTQPTRMLLQLLQAHGRGTQKGGKHQEDTILICSHSGSLHWTGALLPCRVPSSCERCRPLSG